MSKRERPGLEVSFTEATDTRPSLPDTLQALPYTFSVPILIRRITTMALNGTFASTMYRLLRIGCFMKNWWHLPGQRKAPFFSTNFRIIIFLIKCHCFGPRESQAHYLHYGPGVHERYYSDAGTPGMLSFCFGENMKNYVQDPRTNQSLIFFKSYING